MPPFLKAASIAATLSIFVSSGRVEAQSANGPIVFANLNGFALRDCATAPIADSVPCRVRRLPSDRELAARGGSPEAWAVGDTLTFTAESMDSLDILGGVNGPLSRISGKNQWVLSLRIPDIEHALVGYRVMASNATALPARHVWRGPGTGSEAPRASRLRGSVRYDTLDFSEIGDRREIVSYLPAAWRAASAARQFVIYLGDGRTAVSLAPIVDTLIAMGRIPPVALVGIRAARVDPADPESRLARAREYNYGFGGDTSRYLSHERFITQVVMPWAESTLGLPASRDRRMLWGASNGGALAITLALRRADLFGAALADSPVFNVIPPLAGGPAPYFDIAAGSFEPTVEHAASKLAGSLRDSGARVTYERFTGGHDDYAWEESFALQLQRAIAALTRSK